MTLLSIHKAAATELCKTVIVMMRIECYSMHIKDNCSNNLEHEFKQMHTQSHLLLLSDFFFLSLSTRVERESFVPCKRQVKQDYIVHRSTLTSCLSLAYLIMIAESL